MSDVLIGAADLFAVGAITPGPNNFAVLAASVQGEWRQAVAVIAGVLLGGLTLLALLAIGAGSVFAAAPRLATFTTMLACAYLMWVGVKLVADTIVARTTCTDLTSGPVPVGALGLFMFQFLNPKGWLIVAGLLSTGASLPALAALIIVIALACLLVWASAGLLLTEQLGRPSFRAWFNRSMGAAFVASAALLLNSRLALA